MSESLYSFNAHLDCFSDQAFVINKRKDSGIYFLHSGKEIIYIGKTDYLFDRPFSHKEKPFDKATGFKAKRDWLDYLESAFVGLLKPKLNGFTLKDRSNYKDFGVNDKWAFECPETAIHVYKQFEKQSFAVGLNILRPDHAHSVIYEIEAKVAFDRISKNMPEFACP